MQKLVSHGHRKEDVLCLYSRDEIRGFYKSILREDMARQADYIEGVSAGIGAAFGGSKANAQVAKLLKELRKGG